MLDITVIILTKNEAIHIKRCIDSVKQIAKEIIVIDSESTDKTVEIAKNAGASVYIHTWPGNQAAQFNWALDNIPISTEWILRLDADEYPSQELIDEIKTQLPNLSDEISGIMLPLKNVWMGKPLTHGGSKIRILRLFRTGKARYESRMMDEQMEILEGEITSFEHPFVDDNLNNLSWWTNKHINYAIREAAELLDIEYNLSGKSNTENLANLSEDARHRRELKLKYAKQPLFWRSFAYFIYRYFVKGGIFEGKESFLRHFLQGWWYRTLVDANIFQIKSICNNNPQKIKEHLIKYYNIKF